MNGNPSTPNGVQDIENGTSLCGCLPIRWRRWKKSRVSETELSPTKNGGKPDRRHPNITEAGHAEQAPPTTLAEHIPSSESADNRSEPRVIDGIGESPSQHGDPPHSDPSPQNAETQSTRLDTECSPSLESTTTPSMGPTSTPSSNPLDPQLLSTASEPSPIGDTSPRNPPSYESLPGEDFNPYVEESFANEFPDPQQNPTLARIQAEKKFKETAQKLEELVRKTKQVSGEEFETTPIDFSDAAIYKHAESIKAVMEEILKKRSEVTRSKSGQFIDKWFQAMFTVVKSTVQMLSVLYLVL